MNESNSRRWMSASSVRSPSPSASGSGAFLEASPYWSGLATSILELRVGRGGRGGWPERPESEWTRLTTEAVISWLGWYVL